VLLKGSRPARLETVAAELLDAVSSTLLHVDIDAIVENYRRLRVAAGGVSVMPVVKSYGYGVDSVRIAQALERVGASCFCVAFPDEGIALRARGITAAILVQNVLPHEMGKLLRENLSAELGTMTTMRDLEAAAAQQQTVARVHIKFDTGMGRVGFLPAELEQVLAFVQQSRSLEVVGLMTHLASADEPARDNETRAQIAAFERIVAAFAEAGITPRWVHAANTAGGIRFPASRYSGIRAGIGLFGFAPDAAAVGLQRALRLVTRLVSVKELPAEHGVGYGHTYSTGVTPQRIAVAALGYNDGYPRSLSNRGWMSIRGERCPVVGRVCMDVTMLDVTHLDPPPRPGDEVVVFGAGPGEPDLEELAELADTISYELLTRVSPRVRRIFHASAG
jgi:alanine racemase